MIIKKAYNHQTIIDYLDSCERFDNIISYIVTVIPDRFFYGQELHDKEMENLRKDLIALVDEGRKKHKETYNDQMRGFVYQEYQSKLVELVSLKRKLLKFGLLIQSRDIQENIIVNLIEINHLHKYIYRWVLQENRNKKIKKVYVKKVIKE